MHARARAAALQRPACPPDRLPARAAARPACAPPCTTTAPPRARAAPPPLTGVTIYALSVKLPDGDALTYGGQTEQQLEARVAQHRAARTPPALHDALQRHGLSWDAAVRVRVLATGLAPGREANAAEAEWIHALGAQSCNVLPGAPADNMARLAAMGCLPGRARR